MLKTRTFPASLILVCSLILLVAFPEVKAGASAAVSVQTIRYWRINDGIRVVIDLDSQTQYRKARLTGPDRIFFDLSNAKLDIDTQGRTQNVGNSLLKRIRSAHNQAGVVRVVLDLSAAADCQVSEQHDPFRIVVDLQRRTGSRPESELHSTRTEVKKASPKPKLSTTTQGQLKQKSYLLNEVSHESQPSKGSIPAIVENVRFLASKAHTRVFIELESNAHYVSDRLSGPDRIYFEISNSKLSRRFQNHAVSAGDKILKRVRAAQNRPDVVRVVLYVSEKTQYQVSELQSPFSIVVDLHDDSYSLMAASESGPGGSMTLISQPSSNAVQTTDGFTYVAQEDQQQPSVFMEGIESSTDELDRLTSSLRNASLSPVSITGTLSTGYYSSYSRGGGNKDQQIDFVPAGATFDIKGSYISPDLIDYSFKTELNAGAQASDAGFVGGNGVRANITTFRRGAFPLTLRYSNVQLKDVYFGSLTQVSSYTMKNRNKDLGLTAGLRLRGLPSVTMDLGTKSVESESFNAMIPDYTSHFKHMNLNCTDQRWGWDFQCFVGRQNQTSDLFTPQSEGANESPMRQKLTQYRATARRSILSDSELYFEGGGQRTENFLLNRPIDMTTRFVSANLRMFQRSRWKSSLRAGYTSNVSGLLLTQVVGGLGSNGSIAPDEKILEPLQRTTSYFNLNGITSVDLPKGFGLYGSLDRTSVFTPEDKDLDSKYLTTSGGVTYAQAFRWGNLSGQYGRTLGTGSATGQSGRVSGQNYVVTAQPGNPDGLLFDFTVRGSDQKVHYGIPAREHSFSSEMGLAFPVRSGWRARIGGGWHKSDFSNEGNEFNTKGYTAQIAVEHPRFQLSGSLNSSMGNSLQSYGAVVNDIGMGTAFLSPLHLVPSNLRGVTVTLHATPMRKLEISALFTRSIQHLSGLVANDFQVLDINATYSFRRLKITAGYSDSTQVYSSSFAAYPETQRGRFYIRISRPFKLR